MKQRTIATRVRKFTCAEAFDILEAVGSGTDPVALRRLPPKTDATTRDYVKSGKFRDERRCDLWIIADLFGDVPATQVGITFYGGSPCRKVEGTLQDMVLDRLYR